MRLDPYQEDFGPTVIVTKDGSVSLLCSSELSRTPASMHIVPRKYQTVAISLLEACLPFIRFASTRTRCNIYHSDAYAQYLHFRPSITNPPPQKSKSHPTPAQKAKSPTHEPPIETDKVIRMHHEWVNSRFPDPPSIPQALLWLLDSRFGAQRALCLESSRKRTPADIQGIEGDKHPEHVEEDEVEPHVDKVAAVQPLVASQPFGAERHETFLGSKEFKSQLSVVEGRDRGICSLRFSDSGILCRETLTSINFGCSDNRHDDIRPRVLLCDVVADKTGQRTNDKNRQEFQADHALYCSNCQHFFCS